MFHGNNTGKTRKWPFGLIGIFVALVTFAPAPADAEAAWRTPGKCTYPASVRKYTEADDYARNLRTTRVPCFIAAYTYDKWLNSKHAVHHGKRETFRMRNGGARWFVKLSCVKRPSRPIGTLAVKCRVRQGENGEPGTRPFQMRGGTIRWR